MTMRIEIINGTEVLVGDIGDRVENYKIVAGKVTAKTPSELTAGTQLIVDQEFNAALLQQIRAMSNTDAIQYAILRLSADPSDSIAKAKMAALDGQLAPLRAKLKKDPATGALIV